MGCSSGGRGVRGIVKDGITGAPLVGGYVTINAPHHRARINSITPTRSMTAPTNEHGHYEMRRLSAGEYTLTMEMVG